jgi:hypothetical protein
MMKKTNFIKTLSFALATGVMLTMTTSCKKDEVAPVAPIEDTDYQFSATFDGSTYTFKDKTFSEAGLEDGLNLGALSKTFQDTTVMLLSGVNASKDTLQVFFVDQAGGARSSFALGNTIFPKNDINSPTEPDKIFYVISSKSKDVLTCYQTGDNSTLTVTKSDVFSQNSAIKGSFTGKVSSFYTKKQYDISGTFRAKKTKD